VPPIASIARQPSEFDPAHKLSQQTARDHKGYGRDGVQQAKPRPHGVAGGQPIVTVEATIARRRLEEAYCLREATCLFGDAARMDNSNIPFRAEFFKCLDEVTKDE